MPETSRDLENLIAARGAALKARRDIAEALGVAYKRGHTEARDAFIDIQELIEAIDRAIADEMARGKALSDDASPKAAARS
jgi:hypothetical protein